MGNKTRTADGQSLGEHGLKLRPTGAAPVSRERGEGQRGADDGTDDGTSQSSAGPCWHITTSFLVSRRGRTGASSDFQAWFLAAAARHRPPPANEALSPPSGISLTQGLVCLAIPSGATARGTLALWTCQWSH